RAAVENFLKKQQDDLSIMARSKVREQLEALVPRKQAKPILIKMVQDGRIDEVILLLGSMKPQLRKELLRTFDTPDDVDVLYQIQRHMLTEDPARPIIDAQLDALRQLKSQDR
ncbi:MAG TPA: hypothetical protein PKC18_03845, partial [Lacipirellulaceae bacterium]|nr:hypothetical protein [Lacipirellulaceae bacterium]